MDASSVRPTGAAPGVVTPVPAPKFPAFKELEIGPRETADRRLVDSVKRAGGAIGTGVGEVAGFGEGAVKGAWSTVATPCGREEIAGWGLIAAGAGAVVGAIPGLIAGGPAGAAVGALCGAAAGFGGAAAAIIGSHAIDQGKVDAAKEAAAGHDKGVRAGQAVLRAGAAAVVYLGAHSKLLDKIGLIIYKHLQKEPTGAQLDRFHQVDDGIWRGSQPGPDAFKDLAAKGFKTIINLRLETDYEKDEVEALGMKSIHIPEPGIAACTMDEAMQFIDLVKDAANQPVFFHCYSGVDRTGTMTACYRIAIQGWTADRAIQEALEMGMVEELQGAKIQFIRDFEKAWQARQAQQAPPVQIQPQVTQHG